LVIVIFHIFDNSVIFGIFKNITSNELEEKKKTFKSNLLNTIIKKISVEK
jgi:hypothetical protein